LPFALCLQLTPLTCAVASSSRDMSHVVPRAVNHSQTTDSQSATTTRRQAGRSRPSPADHVRLTSARNRVVVLIIADSSDAVRRGPRLGRDGQNRPGTVRATRIRFGGRAGRTSGPTAARIASRSSSCRRSDALQTGLERSAGRAAPDRAFPRSHPQATHSCYDCYDLATSCAAILSVLNRSAEDPSAAEQMPPAERPTPESRSLR